MLKITTPDTLYKFEATDKDTLNSNRLSHRPFTLREAFTELIDITSPPKPELFEISLLFVLR
jgi:hypothetical protein